MSDEKTTTQKFEEAATKDDSKKFVLTLYAAGITPRSLKAIENARQLCRRYLDCYELEIVDVYQQPGLAKDARVIAVPTLIKSLPLPLQKFIGDLSEREPILVRLAVKKENAETS